VQRNDAMCYQVRTLRHVVVLLLAPPQSTLRILKGPAAFLAQSFIKLLAEPRCYVSLGARPRWSCVRQGQGKARAKASATRLAARKSRFSGCSWRYNLTTSVS